MAERQRLLANREMLVNAPNGCINKEDFVGDSLTLDPNLVIFADLTNPQPRLLCFRWSELRRLIEQPDVAEEERVHIYRQAVTAANRVYQLGERWFDPMTEPLTRHYNSFVIRHSYEAPIGSYFGVSRLHGATERLYRLEPIHRSVLYDLVREGLDSAAVSALVEAEFNPLPEDVVAPQARLLDDSTLFLGDLHDGQPYGHGWLWRRGVVERSGLFDGNFALPAPEPEPAPEPVLSPADAAALRQALRNSFQAMFGIAPPRPNVADPAPVAENHPVAVVQGSKMTLSGKPYPSIPAHIRRLVLTNHHDPYIPAEAVDNLFFLEIENCTGQIRLPTIPNLVRVNAVGLFKLTWPNQRLPLLAYVRAIGVEWVGEVDAPLNYLELLDLRTGYPGVLPANYPLQVLRANSNALREEQVPYYETLTDLYWDSRRYAIPDVPFGVRYSRESMSFREVVLLRPLVTPTEGEWVRRGHQLRITTLNPIFPAELPPGVTTLEITLDDANLREEAPLTAFELPAYPTLIALEIVTGARRPPSFNRVRFPDAMPNLRSLFLRNITVINPPVCNNLTLMLFFQCVIKHHEVLPRYPNLNLATSSIRNSRIAAEQLVNNPGLTLA